MVSNIYKENSEKFNALSIRERLLVGITILSLIIFIWWHFLASPITSKITSMEIDNLRITELIDGAQLSVDQIKARLKSGVHKKSKARLARLKQELIKTEAQLKLKATELIDPEEMFQLMTHLINKETKLKLLSLKRRGVKPAIEKKEGQENTVGIYRHLLEVKFSGQYEDIFNYMESLEALEWKLIWEEIAVSNDEYPVVNVTILISTLSMREEWVGV
jgi:MSHA biogenesis protein MshJ